MYTYAFAMILYMYDQIVLRYTYISFLLLFNAPLIARYSQIFGCDSIQMRFDLVSG